MIDCANIKRICLTALIGLTNMQRNRKISSAQCRCEEEDGRFILCAVQLIKSALQGHMADANFVYETAGPQ